MGDAEFLVRGTSASARVRNPDLLGYVINLGTRNPLSSLVLRLARSYKNNKRAKGRFSTHAPIVGAAVDGRSRGSWPWSWLSCGFAVALRVADVLRW